jgi:hypothetical protein
VEHSWERKERFELEKEERQTGMTFWQRRMDDYEHASSEARGFIFFLMPFWIAMLIGLGWLIGYSTYEFFYFISNGTLK